MADVLFGQVNPSGRLPFSMINEWADSPARDTYPGNAVLDDLHTEGIYVGYRYYDKHNVAPRYPFGYGLSYTTFAYSAFTVPLPTTHAAADQPLGAVSVTVTNTGKVAGAEVAELYIRPLASRVDRPVRELKGFSRIPLAPGESRTVTFPLDRAAFSYWSAAQHAWVADPGEYQVEVGSSSRDLPQTATYTLR